MNTIPETITSFNKRNWLNWQHIKRISVYDAKDDGLINTLDKIPTKEIKQ